MSEQPYHPLDSLVFLTNRVGRLLSSDIRKRAGDEVEGLYSTHMGILVDLWMEDGLRQQDLVSSVIKDKGTIARALENLEKQGIVTRETDEADRRNKLIYLTPKGRKLKTVMLPHALAAMEEVLVNIPPEEVAICKKVLQRMYKRLTQKLIHSVPATTTSL
jgi:DNA-binding MarR family transcriptional regulator